MKNRAVLEVDLNLVRRNCEILKKMAGGFFFCPILKASAYGHGAVPVAKTLLGAGVKQVGVISAGEASFIREAVEEMDILIFGPLLESEDLSWAVEEKLVIVCSNWQDLDYLSRLKKPVRIHLKFDTGFSRLGFNPAEAEKLSDFLKSHPQIQLEGLATQLVSGEELGDEKSFSSRQLEHFKKLKMFFSCSNFHSLNTSAMVAGFVHGRLEFGSRPGIGLYGVKPKVFFQNEKAKKAWEELSLSPVSCLKSYVVAVHQIPKGAPVSYGGVWKAGRPSQIAVVSLGYGDGFFRSLDSKREVLFRGKRCPVVGAVCMDFFMIDVTDCSRSDPIKLGEEVVIFGKQGDLFLSPEDQADFSGSISYELFSRLGSRVQRVYQTEGFAL